MHASHVFWQGPTVSLVFVTGVDSWILGLRGRCRLTAHISSSSLKVGEAAQSAPFTRPRPQAESADESAAYRYECLTRKFIRLCAVYNARQFFSTERHNAIATLPLYSSVIHLVKAIRSPVSRGHVVVRSSRPFGGNFVRIKLYLSYSALTVALALSSFGLHPAVAQQPVWIGPGSAPTPAQPNVPIASEPVPVAAVPPVTSAPPIPAAQPLDAQEAAEEPVLNKFYKPIAGKKNKLEYVGPKDVVELAPAPMLDQEGRQRLDPDGKPMFNPAIRQQRDKRGNPFFDKQGKPVMQTASDLGFDDKGKRVHNKKEKPPRMVSVAIERGTLTVDGMTGKAGLNYDIKNLKFIYIYTPWIGTTIISPTAFPGSIEQKNAFNDKTLTVTVEEHTLQIYSDKRLLEKKPESAFVAVDRSFKIPSAFPVMGYGETLKPPYAWPGSKENAALKGSLLPPALPPSVRAVTLLQPCPAGQMRMPGRTSLPGENLAPQPCVAITGALPAVAVPKTQPRSPNQTF